jgi:hypothetical protein
VKLGNSRVLDYSTDRGKCYWLHDIWGPWRWCSMLSRKIYTLLSVNVVSCHNLEDNGVNLAPIASALQSPDSFVLVLHSVFKQLSYRCFLSRTWVWDNDRYTKTELSERCNYASVKSEMIILNRKRMNHYKPTFRDIKQVLTSSHLKCYKDTSTTSFPRLSFCCPCVTR